MQKSENCGIGKCQQRLQLFNFFLQPAHRSSTVHSHEEIVLIVAHSGRSKTSSSYCTQNRTRSKPNDYICKMQADSLSPTSTGTIPRYSTSTDSRRRLPVARRAVLRRSAMPCWRQATTMSYWSTGVPLPLCPGTRCPCRMGRALPDTWPDSFGSC